jgi:hypothetical protein
VRVLPGIGEKTLKKVIAHGLTSVEKIVASPEVVTEVPGVGDKTASKIVAAARKYLGLDAAGDTDAHEAVETGEAGEVAEEGSEGEVLLVGESASPAAEAADVGDGSEVTGGER